MNDDPPWGKGPPKPPVPAKPPRTNPGATRDVDIEFGRPARPRTNPGAGSTQGVSMDFGRPARARTNPGVGATQGVAMDFGRPARPRTEPGAAPPPARPPPNHGRSPAPPAPPSPPDYGRAPAPPAPPSPPNYGRAPTPPSRPSPPSPPNYGRAPTPPGQRPPPEFGGRPPGRDTRAASLHDGHTRNTRGPAHVSTGAFSQDFASTLPGAPAQPDPHRSTQMHPASQQGPPASFLRSSSGSGDRPAALSGADAERERRNRIAATAREFLIHLDTLSRLLGIHDPGNAAVQNVLKELLGDMRRLHADGEELSLVFAEGHAFVNGVWVRASKRAWEAAKLLTEKLSGVEGRGLVLSRGTEGQTLIALTDYLRSNKPGGVSAQDHFKSFGLPGVKLVAMPSAADRGRAAASDQAAEALEIFTGGVATLNESDLANLDLHMRRRQRQLIQQLVQLAENDPDNLLTLTVMRDPTLPPKAHNLMVAIYAIAIGRLMDLQRRDLVRLGMAALLHNVGEALLPEGVFGAERKLQPHERAQLEQHPLLGLGHLLGHYGYGSAAMERSLAAAEHHMRYDGQGGYPYVSPREAHPFSRIVAACDVFDALCSARPWRPAIPPDQAVKLIRRMAGKELDPVVVRRLLWLVGRYPPGTLVELDTAEWGLVLGPGHGAYPLVRPRVLLISDPDGWELPAPVAVDLGERHPRRRAWLRTIKRTHDPNRAGIKIQPFFYAERVEAQPGRLDINEMAPT